MLKIIYGPDSFTRHEALAALKRGLDREGSIVTNTTVFQAATATPAEVIAACSTQGFFDEPRLVVLEGLLAIFERGRGKGRAAAEREGALGPWAALVAFVPEMPPQTTLVVADGQADGNNPMLKALAPLGEVVFCPALDPRKDLEAWIARRAERIGLKLAPGAVRALAALVGGQERGEREEYRELWSLANELEKLRAYSNGAVVQEADVLALTPVLREQKAYLLCDAVLEGRPAAALKLLHELMAQEELPVIISTLAGRYRRLAVARDMLDRGESGAAVAAATGTRGLGLEKLLEAAARHPLDRLRAVYRRLVEADLDAKGGLDDERLALELLVQDLASPAGYEAAASS